MSYYAFCRFLVRGLSLSILLGIFAGCLRAATVRFDNGSGDYTWETTTNWTTDALPTTAVDTARFDSDDYTTGTNVTINGTQYVELINFTEGDHTIDNETATLRTLETDIGIYNSDPAGTVTILTNVDIKDADDTSGALILNSGNIIFGDSGTPGTETVTWRANAADNDHIRMDGGTVTFNANIDMTEFTGGSGHFLNTRMGGGDTGVIRVNSANNGNLDVAYIEVASNGTSSLTFELNATDALDTDEFRMAGGTGSTTAVVGTAGGITINNKVIVEHEGGTNVVGGSNASGTLTLANDFEIGRSGGPTINAATDYQLTAASGGTVNMTGNFQFIEVSGGDGITHAVSKEGDGIFILSGASNDWDPDTGGSGTATLAVNDGILRLNHADAMNGTTSPAITIASGGTLDLNANYSENASWTINGTGHGSLGAIRSSSGTNTLSGTGTITLNDATNNSIGVDSGSSLTISKQITGANPLEKVGDGALTLSSTANDFSGTVTLSGGSLLLGASGVLADTADLNLNGGTFETNGANETLDNLTLTTNSVIDMKSGNSVINFDDFTYAGGTLEIHNWDGTVGQAGGNDQLIFATTFTSNLANIRFYSDAGSSLLGDGRAMFVGNELVPAIPEASTLLGMACGALFAVGYHRRLKFRHQRPAS